MAHLCKVLTAVGVAWFLASTGLCLAQVNKQVKLTIHPQKVPGEVDTFSLLPPEKSLTDGDAFPLYEKAVKALPDKAGDEAIPDWLYLPVDQLPRERAERTLQQYMESLKYVAKAVKCRQCNWPPSDPGKEIMLPGDFRRLASAIRLWARLEMARDAHEEAVAALQMGFGLGRHLGQAPTIIQTLNAIAGQLPGTLSEITEMSVPKDPISGEPFHYTRMGSISLLESALPPDGNEKLQIRYEIRIKN